MYAAMKGKVIDSFVFNWNDDSCPDWFYDQIYTDDCEEDGYGNLVVPLFDSHDEYTCITLSPYEDVILRNKRGDYHVTSIEMFDNMYYEMGEFRAALKTDCVEYFIFNQPTMDASLPDWVLDFCYSKNNQLVFVGEHSYKVLEFVDGNGITHVMAPNCVFIRNRLGMVKDLSFGEFTRNFEMPYVGDNKRRDFGSMKYDNY